MPCCLFEKLHLMLCAAGGRRLQHCSHPGLHVRFCCAQGFVMICQPRHWQVGTPQYWAPEVTSATIFIFKAESVLLQGFRCWRLCERLRRASGCLGLMDIGLLDGSVAKRLVRDLELLVVSKMLQACLFKLASLQAQYCRKCQSV